MRREIRMAAYIALATAVLSIAAAAPSQAAPIIHSFTGSVLDTDDPNGVLAAAGLAAGQPVSGSIHLDPAAPITFDSSSGSPGDPFYSRSLIFNGVTGLLTISVQVQGLTFALPYADSLSLTYGLFGPFQQVFGVNAVAYAPFTTDFDLSGQRTFNSIDLFWVDHVQPLELLADLTLPPFQPINFGVTTSSLGTVRACDDCGSPDTFEPGAAWSFRFRVDRQIAAVSEPATSVLIAIGLLGVLRRRRDAR